MKPPGCPGDFNQPQTSQSTNLKLVDQHPQSSQSNQTKPTQLNLKAFYQL